jgi:hypothetical protein
MAFGPDLERVPESIVSCLRGVAGLVRGFGLDLDLDRMVAGLVHSSCGIVNVEERLEEEPCFPCDIGL